MFNRRIYSFCFILFILFTFIEEINCNYVKHKMGVGTEILSFGSCTYYDKWFPEELAVMYVVSNNIGLIFAGANFQDEGVFVKGGIQGFLKPEKKVSPYLRLDLAWLDKATEDEWGLHPSIGFHYFHNEHFGFAIHTSFAPYLSSGLYIWLLMKVHD